MMTPDPAFRTIPVAETLAIAGQAGERFAISIGGGAAPGFPPAGGLTGEYLSRGIADRRRDAGTDEDRVATALFLQTYVYRVAAQMLAA